MLELVIPGRERLQLAHLVLDYNGTLAVDGLLLQGVSERLGQLARRLDIHIITADTFGLAAIETSNLPVALQIIGSGDQAAAKRALVESLGASMAVAIGNGANDKAMLEAAALGICVLGAEGAAGPALMAADIVVRSPLDALDLLLHPGRVAATLRI